MCSGITYDYHSNRTHWIVANRKIIIFNFGSLWSVMIWKISTRFVDIEIVQVIDATSLPLRCVVILSLIEVSSNVTTLISDILGVRIDLNRSSHLHHPRHFGDILEVKVILHFFIFSITTPRNFSPVRQYKKKLLAKFQWYMWKNSPRHHFNNIFSSNLKHCKYPYTFVRK